MVLDASVKFLTRTMDLCQSVNGKQTFRSLLAGAGRKTVQFSAFPTSAQTYSCVKEPKPELCVRVLQLSQHMTPL